MHTKYEHAFHVLSKKIGKFNNISTNIKLESINYLKIISLHPEPNIVY